MSFQFVDNAASNVPSTRRALRRHVMKGKNTGRKITRGRRHAPRRDDVSGAAKPTEDVMAPKGVGDVGRHQATRPFLFPEMVQDPLQSTVLNGHDLEYFSFPIQFSRNMRYLVYQYHTAIFESIYPYSFCRPPKGVNPPWFEYMISDQAFLHSLLGMAATYRTLFDGPGSETIEATQHFSQAFRLVHGDLSKTSVPGDSTLAVIVTFAIHGGLMQDMHQRRVHLEGIESTLAVRPGGLPKMRDTNRDLLYKICRTDIDYALQAGGPTRFGLLGVVTSPLKSRGRLAHPLNLLSDPLRAVTAEVLVFCRQPEKSKAAGLDYQELITWTWQRLIDFGPLGGSRPPDVLDDVWQLGLLAFLATVTFPTDFLRAASTTLLGEALAGRVMWDPLAARGKDYLPVRFWVAFMCGLLLQGAEGRRPVSRVGALAGELGVASWEDARKVLERFPWIDVVHEKRGRKLWEAHLLDVSRIHES